MGTERVERLFKRTGKILSVEPDTLVAKAAEKMCANEIGCLMVLDGHKAVGILSERDIITGVLGAAKDPTTTTVGSVMARNVISCTRSTPIERVQHLMGAYGIRHVPVIEDDMVLGMISIRDLLGYQLEEARRKLAEANKHARSADEAKKEFLTNMSHEMRTPMNGILGMTEVMLDTALSSDQQECLSVVKESASALLSTITGVLEYSNVAAGGVELEEKPFGLRQVIDATLRIHRVGADAKKLQLTCNVAEDVPDKLVGDQGRLGQVLANLLDNAVKFTERGTVSLQVVTDSRSESDVSLRFSVMDTGPGISPVLREKVFEAFRQVDSSPARMHAGIGLGLATSARLVEKMGGRIWLDSVIGAGTALHFTVQLEISQPAEQPDLEGVGLA